MQADIPVAKVHRNSLKPGHRVHWYEIIEVLGQGGFGITYLATDTNLAQQVAIKEYLPIELAVREGDDSVHPVSEDRSTGFAWGLEKFIAEARTLAQFNHPNIVHVFTVFEANNTAYMVMRYEDGQSLQEILARRKTLEEADLLKMLVPILGGLTLVHEAGFIHRDIKPGNIFIRRDRSPVLLDFGSARQALGERSATLTSLVTPGYAPFQQYYSKSDDQGPWTDIYGLGATLYRAISGVTPIDAIDRSKSIVEGSKEHFVSASEIGKQHYSKRFLRAVDLALAFKSQDRPQTIAEWLTEFRVPAGLAGIEQASAGRSIGTRLGFEKLFSARLPRRFVVLYVCIVVGALGMVVFLNPTDTGRLHDVFERMTSTLFQPKATKSDPASAEHAAALRRTEARIHAEQAALLAQAESFERDGHRLEPRGENALERYDQILEHVPDHVQALAGKHRLLDYFLDRANTFITDGRFDEADGALLRAAVVDPDSTELRLIRVALKDAEADAARIAVDEARVREEAERLRLAAIEKERLEKERRALEAERMRVLEQERELAEEARRQDEARRAELERVLQQEAAAARAEEEKRARFGGLLADAEMAAAARDKEVAVRNYQAALALYPNDPRAQSGLRNAEQLLHKVCYEVLGRWEYKRLFGTDTMVIKEGGGIDYHSTVSGGGRWECVSPGSRTIRITLTAAGFSNTWDANLSADGACLDAAQGGCFVRP